MAAGQYYRVWMRGNFELVTVTGSNLFRLDDYIKEYLQTHPELSIGAQLKIILRELITHDIIVQLKELKTYLDIKNFSY